MRPPLGPGARSAERHLNNTLLEHARDAVDGDATDADFVDCLAPSISQGTRCAGSDYAWPPSRPRRAA
eukprot:3239021-Lingulodinium_polyedra.AAC.1